MCLCSCIDDVSVISPEEFQKRDQELLGDHLFNALTRGSSTFEILDKEENKILYNHIESLYRQSYFILRSKQGWTSSREWRIAIFNDDNQSAFGFPGGNMMISTGMLKTFNKEYELFYLMSFENTLMDSGFLFANFLTYIEDSIDVERLIEEADSEEAYAIGNEMVERLEFNELITEETDLAAMEWICQSSNFRTDGILSIFPKLVEDSAWSQSRKSSLNRTETARDNFLALGCENDDRATALGNTYYVDVILPLIP